MADMVYPGDVAGKLNADAMPSNQDLVIYKGDYVEIFVTVKDSSGVAVSLTGSTPKAQLKVDYNDVSPINFTCTLTANTGEVRIYLSSTTASSLAPGSYIWDFQITAAGGDTRTYLAGDVYVYNEVTT